MTTRMAQYCFSTPTLPRTTQQFIPTLQHSFSCPRYKYENKQSHNKVRFVVAARARNGVRNKLENPDVIIIGSGFGGLCAGAMLTAYGKKPLILESHYAPGGTAHGFDVCTKVGTFHFDTGPSFFCGLTCEGSLNPVKQALDAVHERVEAIPYTKFAVDDIESSTTIYMDESEKETLSNVRNVLGTDAANQLERFYKKLKPMHAAMRVPSVALRGDWKIGMILGHRWSKAMLQLLPFVNKLQQPIGNIMKETNVTHPLVQRLLDIESFLLSGLKTDATITAEIAFMFGERAKKGSVQYPIGGARAIVDALVRGIERHGGEVRLRSHVDEIIVENNTAVGVRLRGKRQEIIRAPFIFSNASIWDTVKHLLPTSSSSLPQRYRTNALSTPIVESFMHVHIAVPSTGMNNITNEELIGHHVIIIDNKTDIAKPGNCVMLSIPTVWSPDMAPSKDWHIIHAYTLEPWDEWPSLKQDRTAYEKAKLEKAQPLFKAIRYVIPDLDKRLEHPDAICKIGSPLTHERFNRRYKGTYGAAIRAGQAEFEWPGDIPIKNLKRCSDSTFPGIGVPSSAAAGLIAANELVGVFEHIEAINKIFPSRYDRLL